MRVNIGMEDLAANALIEAMEKGKKRFLTYHEIEEYGMRVVQILREKEEKAVLLLSRESMSAFYRNYSEFFEEKRVNGVLGIELRAEKDAEDLIDTFRGYLTIDVLMAFVDKRSVEALGVSA